MKPFLGLLQVLILFGCSQLPTQYEVPKNWDLSRDNVSLTFEAGMLPVYGEVVEAAQLREHGMAYAGPIEVAALQLLIQGAVTGSVMKNKEQKLQKQANQVLDKFGEMLQDIEMLELSRPLPESASNLDRKFSVHFSPKMIVSQDTKFITLQTAVKITNHQTGEIYSNLVAVSDEFEAIDASIDSDTAKKSLKSKISNLLKTTYEVLIVKMPNAMDKCGGITQRKYKKSGNSKVIIGRYCGTIAEKQIFLTNRNNYLAIPSYLIET